ncbi:MAG TPA: protein kinase [Kofleriaceae bacterium]|nr:protein kinase [Kofleriaceae bacterium]
MGGRLEEDDDYDRDDSLIGQVLASRYQIESRIGEGAMGAVYKAKHVKVGRPFAVKVLHLRLLEDRKTLQRFEREAELAGRLRHPNVIGVVDVGELASGSRYMVMDFADGADLAALLSEAPMPPGRIIHLTRQLLEGLYHAHEQGLIHRDFKPENVIVERDTHGDEVPRIVDFGIAILREGGDSADGPGRLTTNGLVLGTPHYMAPEQAVADPIDHRIDLFALGIIIYEMLCGKLPFDGSGAEVARANLLLDPPKIADRVPYLQVDPLLEAFARRLMAKKRDNRPATAKAARELLDLIEKDRNAAAAALGVPLDAARPILTTQDSQPLPRHAGDYPGTFPPPLGREAPTPQHKPAIEVTAPRSEKDIDTLRTGVAGTRRRWPLGVALLGAAGLAAAVLALTRHGDEEQPAKQPVPVVMASTPPAPATTPAPAPAPTPPPTAAPVDDPGKSPTQETAPAVAETPKPAVDKPKPARPKQVKAETPAPVETPKAPVEIAKPAETPKAVDTATLVAQYKNVGAELKALEQSKGVDVASDLQSRYRMIRIADAMASQDKRDETAKILAKLHADIAARK